jgi:hypothetical protein
MLNPVVPKVTTTLSRTDKCAIAIERLKSESLQCVKGLTVIR